MGIFSFVSKALSETPLGTLAERAIDAVLPEKMTEEEKANFKAKMDQLGHERNMQILHSAQQADEAFNKRTRDLEGTASDLKSIPFIGSIVIFLRGVQRPLWGFSALYMDFLWFSGSWGDMTERQETSLIVINILVLGFLFGERAVKNLTPLIVRVFGPK